MLVFSFCVTLLFSPSSFSQEAGTRRRDISLTVTDNDTRNDGSGNGGTEKVPSHNCADVPQAAIDMDQRENYKECCEVCYKEYYCTSFEIKDGDYGMKCFKYDREPSQDRRGNMYYKTNKPYLDEEGFCRGSYQNYAGAKENSMWIQTMSMDSMWSKLNLGFQSISTIIGFGKTKFFVIQWPKTCIFRAYLQRGGGKGKNLEEDIDTGHMTIQSANTNKLTQYFFAQNVVGGGGQHYIRSLVKPDGYYQAVVDDNCMIKKDERPIFASKNVRCPYANQWIMADP